MLQLSPPLRRAGPADAAQLAELVNFAGEGLPEHLWRGMAAEGEDPWDLGRARQAQKAAESRIFVVDQGAGAVAALTGYAIPAAPEPVPDDMPPILRPLQELENLAPSTWYVNVLAAYPHERGKGHGTRLLALAETLARAAGSDRLSLIVADGNHGAERLYRRLGYAEAARRPIIKDGWRSDSDDWVLMIKGL